MRTRALTSVLAVLAALLLPLVGPAGSASSAQPVAARALIGHELYETVAFTATNLERTLRGKVSLGPQACLQRFANRQARRMAEQRRMFHQQLGPILKECPFSLVGENVAYGFSTGKAVVNAWMNSPDHRANILEPRYRRMAIAARKGSDGSWYVAQVFGGKA